MDLTELRHFAELKLKEYGLAQKGWRFAFDHARVRFGACRYDRKVISVSKALARINDEASCFDTVLHEIAHALVGRDKGHGSAWKTACLRVGARPERCYQAHEVNHPEPNYWGECPSCRKRTPLYRVPAKASACGPCCKQHSKGRYDVRFRLRVLEAASGQEVPTQRTPAYLGICPVCQKKYEFYRKQNFNKACGACCETRSGGRFDERFRLRIFRVARAASA